MSSSSGREEDDCSDEAVRISSRRSGARSSVMYQERRREAHTQAEQKRRDAIKKGYDSLQSLVPRVHQGDVSGYKPSKATILQKSIDYIQFLEQAKVKEEEERNALRKEVVALKIMKSNYEQMVRNQQNQPGQPDSRLPDKLKFQVFQSIVDQLFESFSKITVINFQELSSFAFTWLEQYCKPQALREMVVSVLRTVLASNRQLKQEQS